MSHLIQQMRYALRMLVRAPGLSAAAIVSLAIGIGANTALFSVVNGLLLEPLPYPDSDRLGLVWLQSPGLGILRDWPSPGQFIDLKTQSQSFEDIAIVRGDARALTGGEEPMLVGVLNASSNLFTMLGAKTQLGRLFTADDDVAGKARVGVLSHGFWQQHFGGDPGVIGRTLTVGGDSVTVVGVLSADFLMNHEIIPTVGGIERMEIYVPLQLPASAQTNRGSENYNVLVRLKRDATWTAAQTEVTTIAARIREADNRHVTFGMTVTPLLDLVVGNVRQAVLVLFGSVALVLLVACANVANLLLARAAAREKELAVRTALGAGRGTLIGQLLLESITLSLLGGVLGVAVAATTLAAVRAFNPGNIPRLDQIGLDWQVLGFTLLVSVLAGIVFGLVPALRAGRVDVHTSLKSGGRTGQTDDGLSLSRLGARGLLVVGEVALSLMLLVGAGLLIRSFAGLIDVAPGFEPNRLLSLQAVLSSADARDPALRSQFFERVEEAVQAVPGISAAGETTVLPFTASLAWGAVTVEGYTPPPGESDVQVDQRTVTSGYFAAMGIPLVEGRFFARSDTDDGPFIVVVDERMAQQFWPNESPIGKRLKSGRADSRAPWGTVVGVVGSVKQYGLEVEGRGVVYTANAQQSSGGMFVVARTGGDPAAQTAAVIRAIRSVDPQTAVFDVATMDERIFKSLARPRFAMIMLTAFAGFALLLAALGIYGVVWYLVAQRTRDIGIRMALGAERENILAMVFRHGLVLTVGGVVVGLAGAFAVTRLMSSLLFEVSSSDVATFSAVPVLLGAVALAASYIPARRATRIDPMVALRDE